jgi:hypothetical protein
MGDRKNNVAEDKKGKVVVVSTSQYYFIQVHPKSLQP